VTYFSPAQEIERAQSTYDALVLAQTIQESGGAIPQGFLPNTISFAVLANLSKMGVDPRTWTNQGYTFDPRIMGLSLNAPVAPVIQQGRTRRTGSQRRREGGEGGGGGAEEPAAQQGVPPMIQYLNWNA
jgi:hypothetical protein